MTYTVKRAIYISVNLQLEPTTEQCSRSFIKNYSLCNWHSCNDDDDFYFGGPGMGTGKEALS